MSSQCGLNDDLQHSRDAHALGGNDSALARANVNPHTTSVATASSENFTTISTASAQSSTNFGASAQHNGQYTHNTEGTSRRSPSLSLSHLPPLSADVSAIVSQNALLVSRVSALETDNARLSSALSTIKGVVSEEMAAVRGDFINVVGGMLAPLIEETVGRKREREVVEEALCDWGLKGRDPAMNGRGPLHHAAIHGNLRHIHALVSSGRFFVDERNNDLVTPLINACRYNQLESVKELLFLGANGNARGSRGFTCLMIAAENGYKKMVEYLLRPTFSLPCGSLSPLRGSLKQSNNAAHSHAASDSNSSSHPNHQPPPASASAKSDGVPLRVPVCDPCAEDDKGWTALHYAAKRGHRGVINLLLGLPDVDVNARNCRGRTPLMLAAIDGRLMAVEALVKAKGVNIKAIDDYGETAESLVSTGEEAVWGTKRLILGLLSWYSLSS